MNWLSSTLNAAEDFLNKVDAGAANLKAGTDVGAPTLSKGGDGGEGFETVREIVDVNHGDEEGSSSYDDEEHEQRAVFRSIAEMRPKGRRPRGYPSQSPLSPILSVGEPSPQAQKKPEDWVALLESEEPSEESLSPRKKKAISSKNSATQPLSKLSRDRDSSDSELPLRGLPRPIDPAKKETGVAVAPARPSTSPKRTPSEKASISTNSRSSSPSSYDPEPKQAKPSRSSKLSKPRSRESTKPEEFSKMIELGRSAVRERFSAAAEAALEGDSIRRGSLAAAESHAKQLASLREACLAQADRWNEEAGRQMAMRSRMEQSAMDLQDSALTSAKELADSQRRLADITSFVLSQRNELDLQSRQNDRLRRELDRIQERGGEEESESGRGSRSPRWSPRSPRREGSGRGNDSIEEELAETMREIEVLERRKARLSDRMQEKQATSPEESALDAELFRATDALLSLQSEIETVSVRRQGLRMRCETLRSEQSAMSSSSSQGPDGYRNGATDLEDPPRDKKNNNAVGSLCGLAKIAEHKGWVSKQVVDLAAALDSLSLFGGTVLESNRTARIFLYVYVVVLHVWFYFVVSKLA